MGLDGGSGVFFLHELKAGRWMVEKDSYANCHTSWAMMRKNSEDLAFLSADRGGRDLVGSGVVIFFELATTTRL